MDIKHDINSIRLTSSELAYLWATYIMESKGKQAISCLLVPIYDADIKSVMQLACDLADKNTSKIQDIFNIVGAPIPYGFTEKDINKDAAKLFSDSINLYILKIYTTFGLTNYSIALSMAARTDAKQFFNDCLTSTIDLSNKIDEVLLKKGIFCRTPYVTISDEAEFAHNQNILGHFIGHNRPLNYFEITHLFNSSMTMTVVEAVLTALSQIVKDKKLEKYCLEGKKIAEEHIKTLNSVLRDEELTTPKSLTSEITNSTQPLFSDRLCCYFALTILNEMLNAYSNAKLNAMRKDIMVSITTLSMKLSSYIKDGIDIMLENGWYEKVPENINHNELIMH